MKNSITIKSATYGSAWKDLIKVHSSVRIPSPLLNSLTRRITRNKRKKLMEIMLVPGYNRCRRRRFVCGGNGRVKESLVKFVAQKGECVGGKSSSVEQGRSC